MNSSIIKYSIDQQTGQPVFIDNAQKGLFYICAKCGNKMIVVKGEQRKKEWHFRHYEDTDCTGGQETAIHKLAKTIILENSQIHIPNEELVYSQAREEEPFNSIIPDVVVVSNGQNIYFEISVTHPVESSKEKFYVNGQHKSIEIDLSGVSYDILPEDLEKLVINEIKNKRKIFWEVEQPKKPSSASSILILLLAIGTFLFLLFKGRRTKKR